VLSLEDHRRRDGSRIACPTVGVAVLLLERHATPADGGPCPDFPRPSLVKQRAVRDAENAERPTWLMAQVGRLVSLPNPSSGHSLRSATSCLGPCTNRGVAWLLIRNALPVLRPGVADGRERARDRPANRRQSHRRESEIDVRRRHEFCRCDEITPEMRIASPIIHSPLWRRAADAARRTRAKRPVNIGTRLPGRRF
jgi:hypothetical protein